LAGAVIDYSLTGNRLTTGRQVTVHYSCSPGRTYIS